MALPAEPMLASTLYAPLSNPSEPPPQPRRLATNHRALDIALSGGLDYGLVSCLSAESSSTASAAFSRALLLSHLLSNPAAKATVVDTTLAFDVGTLHASLLSALGSGAVDGAAGERERERALAVLDRLSIMRVFDFVGLAESLDELGEELDGKPGAAVAARTASPEAAPFGTVDDSEDEGDEMLDAPASAPPPQPPAARPSTPARAPARTGLLVIDNITNVTTRLLQSNPAQSLALLTSLLRSLAHLAQTHNLCVLLLNTASSSAQHAFRADLPSIFASCPLRPALGKTFSFALDLHLLAHRLPRAKADSEAWYGQLRRGDREEVASVDVLEVVQDRYAGRVGRWGAFAVDADGRLKDAL